MGNANVIPSDVLAIMLEYFDIYDQLIHINKVSQLNKKYYQFIQYENINLWITVSKNLSGCEICTHDAESMFYSSLTTAIPKKYQLLHMYEMIDQDSLWDQYCDSKRLLFWKSMCKTYLSHRRIRRQRHTRFASRIMSYNNSNFFKAPPRGVFPEDIFCHDIRTPHKSLSTPSSPSKPLLETQPNTPMSTKSASSVSPMIQSTSYSKSSSSQHHRRFSFDDDTCNFQQIMTDLNLFLWNEGGLFNIWSSAAVLLSNSSSNSSTAYHLHSHETTKTSSLLAYSLKFTVVSRCYPEHPHPIYTAYKESAAAADIGSSYHHKKRSGLKSLVSSSWCSGAQFDPWHDVEAINMIQDLLTAVGIQPSSSSAAMNDDESYQLYWLEGRLPNSFLYEDSDDRFIVLVNLVTHIDVSSASAITLTSTRMAGIHVTLDLHRRIVQAIDHCLPVQTPANHSSNLIKESGCHHSGSNRKVASDRAMPSALSI